MRRKPKCELSYAIMLHLGARRRSMPSVIPAWRKMTGRCGVWYRWKTRNRTFWGIAEAMVEQCGNVAPLMGLDSHPPILS